MNERIESIAIETLNHLRHNVLSRSDMEDVQVPDVFIEKFAELIVRECKENFTKVWYEQGMDHRGAELGKFMTRFEEHFGVSE